MHFTDACEEHEEHALLCALAELNDLKSSNLEVRMGEKCGVVIAYGVHVRGIWHAGHGDFDYVPAGYNEPTVIVKSLDEVIALTRELFVDPTACATAKEKAGPPKRAGCCAERAAI